MLKNELFETIQDVDPQSKSAAVSMKKPLEPLNGASRLLRFNAPTLDRLKAARRLDFGGIIDSPNSEKYSVSPVRPTSQAVLQVRKKPPRYISKVPFKVLDAPELADDFYLNLVDWGSSNILGVGLGSSVYLWSACTSRVTKLCDIGPYDSVTSVNWIQKVSSFHCAYLTEPLRALTLPWEQIMEWFRSGMRPSVRNSEP